MCRSLPFCSLGYSTSQSGYAVLAVSVILGFVVDRDLGKSLLLIGFGIGIIGTISLAADISYGHMVLMGSILLIAVVVPYVVDRFVFKRHIVRFPINTGRRWTTGEYVWLVSVVGLAWLIMPFYFITSGTYLNWPAVHEPSELIRLFIAVNAVGLWDELFFICTAFALLRHHFVMWQANILQAIIFVSFLWELGYAGLGTIPDHHLRPRAGLHLQPHAIAAVRRQRALGLRLRAVGHTCARSQSRLAADLRLLLTPIAGNVSAVGKYASAAEHEASRHDEEMSLRSALCFAALVTTLGAWGPGTSSSPSADLGMPGAAAASAAPTATPPATSSPKQTKSATQTSATVPETLRFSGTTVDGKPFDGASLVGAAAAAIALAKSSLTERLRRSGRIRAYPGWAADDQSRRVRQLLRVMGDQGAPWWSPPMIL